MEQVVSAAERWAKEIKAAVCRGRRRCSVAGLVLGKSEALSTKLLSVGGEEPVRWRAQERRSAARRKELLLLVIAAGTTFSPQSLAGSDGRLQGCCD